MIVEFFEVILSGRMSFLLLVTTEKTYAGKWWSFETSTPPPLSGHLDF